MILGTVLTGPFLWSPSAPFKSLLNLYSLLLGIWLATFSGANLLLLERGGRLSGLSGLGSSRASSELDNAPPSRFDINRVRRTILGIVQFLETLRRHMEVASELSVRKNSHPIAYVSGVVQPILKG